MQKSIGHLGFVPLHWAFAGVPVENAEWSNRRPDALLSQLVYKVFLFVAPCTKIYSRK